MRSTGVREKVVDTHLYESENKRCRTCLQDEVRPIETTVEESYQSSEIITISMQSAAAHDVGSFGCNGNTVRVFAPIFCISITVAVCLPQTMAHVPWSLAELLRMKFSCFLSRKLTPRLCSSASFSPSFF